jgi:DNA mismatch repair protein MutS
MAEGIVGEYRALKRAADADLLAMQMGDFYEFFGEDAETVGRELDLKVSERSSGGETYSMAGVPVDDLDPYVRALIERGYRVAVADQHEVDAGHEREVTRVVTPGTLGDPGSEDAQYLACLVAGEEWGLAFLDVTTGRFLVTAVPDREAALTELYRFGPAELVPGPEARNDDALATAARERVGARITVHEAEAFAPGRARHAVREQFGAAPAAVGLDGEAALRAAGGALAYADETGTAALAAVTRLRTYQPDEHVALDATTQRNLELVEPMTEGGQALFDVLDHTATPAGGRRLREWLVRPLRDRAELSRRSDAVAALAEAALAREEVRDLLGEGYDLERLASRAVSGSADPPALARIRETLGLVPDLAESVERAPALAASPAADLLDGLAGRAADLHATLSEALAADPPASPGEGGAIRTGYDGDLDALIADHEEARAWIEGLDDRLEERHGLSRVTVDRNKTDGYYVQVPKSQSDAVPDAFEGIKTLKNAERYVTPELREREREVLRLEERRGDLEREIFAELRERVAERADLLQDAGRALAELDALASLAVHAVRHDWVRPDLVAPGPFEVEGGRHPVVETTTEFVPNDLDLPAGAFRIVTGPNMSGKSTYMRQAALIALLAQVGSFVPADSARVGLVDGIYTRVGALDELAGGRSTFMVEMEELSNILHSATGESLIVLDEVGRGTATYDGISIAWAATEYLHNAVGAKTLFATHYHELTALAEHLERVENLRVAVDERDGEITFLRTVDPGATDRSFGVHVADLAGVPRPVVERAREVLDRLREEKAIEARGSGSNETVQAVFDLGSGGFRGGAAADGGDSTPDPATEAVLEELRTTDVESTPPLELMATVQEWQERLEE